ncbi:amidase [Pseudonocardia asaccharolytica]|uniref:Amidase n=1 Tax=Pseudonocardia asaccharolytica DSM 44247 = NBRC 16224 TaxID=1123024 RepID=A0A511D2Y3_9PSEU|nr:amidase [Pseudonocardia asaccharolytica]GEL19139.1 amidase [Pseudonocardia asaccharolytica DSM 44247 = NBRC 16224]
MTLSIRDLALALRSGELSPTEHVRNVLDRLHADEHNAVVMLDDEQALAEAAARTEELARGEWRGPMHGVAVGVKDLFDVVGLSTKAGSKILADAPSASTEGPVVARLREAGAVIVGKLHTHEFAYGPTGDVSASGPARNPLDPSRITGGSSSGSAAAVAAGHLPLTLGTDTGASVRTPAALCGVVGLKPTRGRLSTEGVFPLSETCDHVGLLTADVHSASVAWDVLSRAEGTGGGIQAPGVSGVRVGVLPDPYWQAAEPMLNEGVAEAVAMLEKAGAQVTEIATPMIDQLAATYFAIVGAEAYATHAPWLAERGADYQPMTLARLEPNEQLSARTYINAQRARRRLTAALRTACDAVDVLVLPTTQLRATPIGQTKIEIDDVVVPVASALLALTLPFNLAGWPAISVPRPATDGGLPVGVQIVGVGLEERGILRVAAALDRL